MTWTSRLIETLHQPAYTGENRCLPCTIVNLGIALGVSGLLVFVSPPVGLGVFLVSLGVIYLRGYLVPGTPELTKRYLPTAVLRWFGTHPEITPHSPIEIDPETVLRRAAVIEPCAADDDLCLTAEFQTAWKQAIETNESRAPASTHIGPLLGVDGDRLTVDQPNGAYTAIIDEEFIGQWESDAALLADSAINQVLHSQLPDWDTFSPQARSQILRGARLFLDDCPVCESALQLDTDTVESCCDDIEVVTVNCRACEARLLEVVS